MNILIAESDKALHSLYTYSLKAFQNQIALVCTGEETMHALQEHTPKLIFLNLMLPIVSGKDVLQYIRSTPRLHTSHVAVICTVPHHQSYIHHLPSAEFHLKPIMPADIKRIALKIMGPA